MKISEYIKELEGILKEHGDLDCFYHDNQGDETESNGPMLIELNNKDRWQKPTRVIT